MTCAEHRRRLLRLKTIGFNTSCVYNSKSRTFILELWVDKELPVFMYGKQFKHTWTITEGGKFVKPWVDKYPDSLEVMGTMLHPSMILADQKLVYNLPDSPELMIDCCKFMKTVLDLQDLLIVYYEN